MSACILNAIQQVLSIGTVAVLTSFNDDLIHFWSISMCNATSTVFSYVIVESVSLFNAFMQREGKMII
ncbi:hypothetical protein BC941DRAFT_411646 [Chlamydoabsidia padenii]|nr:hypothetical protein BC941DRAFT_411646 [Chlamydoabsidia padenii]